MCVEILDTVVLLAVNSCVIVRLVIEANVLDEDA